MVRSGVGVQSNQEESAQGLWTVTSYMSTKRIAKGNTGDDTSSTMSRKPRNDWN